MKNVCILIVATFVLVGCYNDVRPVSTPSLDASGLALSRVRIASCDMDWQGIKIHVKAQGAVEVDRLTVFLLDRMSRVVYKETYEPKRKRLLAAGDEVTYHFRLADGTCPLATIDGIEAIAVQAEANKSNDFKPFELEE